MMYVFSKAKIHNVGNASPTSGNNKIYAYRHNNLYL